MLRNLFYVLLATLVFFIAMALFPFIAVGYILLLGYAIVKVGGVKRNAINRVVRKNSNSLDK